MFDELINLVKSAAASAKGSSYPGSGLASIGAAIAAVAVALNRLADIAEKGAKE